MRAQSGRHDAHFDTEGNYSAWLEFENGIAATMVFNGYGYFDITELTWGIGESGRPPPKSPAEGAAKPRITGTLPPAEKYALPPRHGGADARPFQPFFGLTVVSCEKGVLRQSPQGIFCYDAQGCREIPCGAGRGRGDELIELRNAVREGREAFPDGRWGKATLEVCLGILTSSRERREIALAHQTGCADAPL